MHITGNWRSQLIVLMLSDVIRYTTPAGVHHHIFTNLSTEYDVNEWPTMQNGTPTCITVQMYFNAFGSLNAAHMDFKLDLFLRQRWNDPRMLHSSDTEHFTVMDPDLTSKLWKPDTFFQNVKEAHIHMVTLPNMLLRVHENGDILYSTRITLRLTCHLQLRMYPFDSQKCFVNLTSYANTEDVVRYQWTDVSPLTIPDDIEIAEFDLLAHDTSQFNLVYSTGLITGNFSGLSASFTLRRQSGYHLLQTYIPTIMIVAISWVSFWLDPNAVPGRVTLGVTTLLTLTTLSAGIRQTLPPVSYVKAIDIWIGMCMTMVFGALLEFTLVNFLANRQVNPSSLTPKNRIKAFLSGGPLKSPESREAAPIRRRVVGPIELLSVHRTSDDEAATPDTGYLPKQGGKTEGGERDKHANYMHYALKVDKFSRIFFPTSFGLFNLAYWLYFVIQQKAVNEVLKKMH